MVKLMQNPCPINPVFQKYNWKNIHQNILALSQDYTKIQSSVSTNDRPSNTEASKKIEEIVRHAALLS